MDLIIGLTGASGAIYGINLLKALQNIQDCNIHLIISDTAKQIIAFETDEDPDNIRTMSGKYYENTDLAASIASGSKVFDAMVIIPCSMSTVAKINNGIADNLITRTADVCMKEHRKLIIVPRETPCSTTHLKNLLGLSEMGVVVLPAMPGFYHKPKNLQDLINFIVGKILDQLELHHDLFTRWPGGKVGRNTNNGN
jgi:4-hydroxy-3-polyprenylbenzoate decarboxylase